MEIWQPWKGAAILSISASRQGLEEARGRAHRYRGYQRADARLPPIDAAGQPLAGAGGTLQFADGEWRESWASVRQSY